MRKTLAVAIVLACSFCAPAHSAVTLVARGSVSATTVDFSGLDYKLENGQSANQFGGLGSALAWAGDDRFIALPDRGPNATSWNVSVDHTTSWVPRFHTLTLKLSARPEGNLPMTLTAELEATTLLYTKDVLAYGPFVPPIPRHRFNYFSGRSDNFDPATDSQSEFDARLDPEGVRVSNNGKRVYVTDEYGPYVFEFSRSTGKRTRVFKLPPSFAVRTKSALGASEISDNQTGRVANKGMEGLAISPDGSTLFGFEQSPLIQDGGDGGRANRIVKIKLDSGEVSQYAYDNFIPSTGKAYNSSEILAINDHAFLVLERDGKGLGDNSAAAVKQLWKVDLAGATEVSHMEGATALLAVAPSKTLFADLRAILNVAGITDAQIPAKLEGMAFGKDITLDGVRKHTLYVSNDNDFLAVAPGGLPNPNQFFVFAFEDADLGGTEFVAQKFN